MNSLLILAALKIAVIFSENPAMDCGYFGVAVNGCNMADRIIISYNNPTYLLHHETGHYLDEDEEIRKAIEKYPSPKKYDPTVYKNEQMITSEKVADYYAMYSMPDKYNFSDKYPELVELFKRKIDGMVATGTVSIK